jgi:cellulose synthase/poly-beta-1,6-N-acetylglucosamine synthase-like glycosyltransferase
MYLFYFFAAILIFLGYKSLRGGIDYLRYFKRELTNPKSDFTPFASVFVPCRGLDQDLHENLSALFQQDYPNYEVIFIVDDENDEAVSIIEKSKNPISTKLVIAGKAENEGQKVHNLRQAVLEVSDKSEVFVFVDSDARPAKDWLRNLIAPLKDEKIGCSTGYRWFIAKKNNFSSQLRSVWNASIASALGANANKNFCWGGSTAIRREIFEKIGMREKWKGTLSDDFAMTRAMKEANLSIYFVPNCLTATVEDCGFSELLEFTTRQMKITRVYAPHLWKASFIGSALFTITFWTGVVLLFFVSGWHFVIIFSLLLIIFALGIAKAWVRLSAVKMVLKNYEKELNKSFLWQISLWTISSALYFYNCFCAFQSNVISWRGITYKLESPNKTIILESGKK